MDFKNAYGNSYKAEQCERWHQEDMDTADRFREQNQDAEREPTCYSCVEAASESVSLVSTTDPTTGEKVTACAECILAGYGNPKDLSTEMPRCPECGELFAAGVKVHAYHAAEAAAKAKGQ